MFPIKPCSHKNLLLVLLVVASVLLSLFQFFLSFRFMSNEFLISNETFLTRPARYLDNSTALRPIHQIKLPPPVQVLRQYIQWHSVEAVGRQPHNRTFSVAFYSCPLQAGNRLHAFLNAFLWSILTNRTMLWKYYDKESCLMQQKDEPLGESNCYAANTVDDCDRILQRALWIPSFDESGLNVPNKLDFWSTHPQGIPLRVQKHHKWTNTSALHQGLDTRNDLKIVNFPIMLNRRPFLEDKQKRDTLLKTDWARDNADKLYMYGVNFLLGLLFRASFKFQFPHNVSPASDDVFSIAIHSRHVMQQNDGADIQYEMECVDKLLRRSNENRLPCKAYVMSDREITISRLQEQLVLRNCSVSVAAHNTGTSFRTEHGPFAGLGFFQDWVWVSQARSALIGKLSRTSTSLILELIEYDRRMEAWRKGIETIPDLKICELKV